MAGIHPNHKVVGSALFLCPSLNRSGRVHTFPAMPTYAMIDWIGNTFNSPQCGHLADAPSGSGGFSSALGCSEWLKR